MRLLRNSGLGVVLEAYIRRSAAASGIAVDDSAAQKSMAKLLADYQRILEDKNQLGQTPLDIRQYHDWMQRSLSQLKDQEVRDKLQAITDDVVSKYEAAKNSPDAIENLRDNLTEVIGGLMRSKWADVREFYRALIDLDAHLSALGGQTDVVVEVAQYKADLDEKRRQYMAQAEALKSELAKFLGATGTDASLVLETSPAQDEYKMDVYFPMDFSMDVRFPGSEEDWSPNMTLFSIDENGQPTGKYQVDDVLEWGDTDLFQDDNQRTTYFQLVEFLRSGRLPHEKGQKFISLYRGMSTDEYVNWERGQVIPRGKFFTSQRTSQLAQDISGQFPELFSFRVREDAVSETSPGTYQTIMETILKGKKIVPSEGERK